MNVVDVGCYDHPTHRGHTQSSVERLVRRYQPERLFGFDPLQPGVTVTRIEATRVTLYPYAAWTYDGTVTLDVPFSPLGANTVNDTDTSVRCVDLAEWIEDGTVLKVDVEGGEYDLLEHLIATGAIERVAEVLVEWHPAPNWKRRKAAILAAFKCPVLPW